jgi:cytochrome c5
MSSVARASSAPSGVDRQDWAPRHAEYVVVIDDAALEGDSADALGGKRR